MDYKVIYITDDLLDCLENNPFNLKKDFKKIGIKTKNEELKIAEAIVSELKHGFGRKDCVNLFCDIIDKKENIFIILAKIKLNKKNNNIGNELRCIVLVDQQNELCLVLHLYAKKNKSDLTPIEKKEAKQMLLNYSEMIKKESVNNG